MPAHALKGRDLVLLALLTLFWGLNWPVMKYAVRAFPPLSFRALSMFGGVLVLAAYMAVQRIEWRVPRGQLGRVLLLATPNMVVWNVLVIYGVTTLSSGRAAILGYTMPVWSLLFGVMFFRERVPLRMWAGVAAAFVGTLLLLASELTAFAGKPLGVAIMLVAAMSWGLGTLLIKHRPIAMPTVAFSFWATLVTALVTGAGALLLERTAWHVPSVGESLAVFYNAAVALGFCQVVWFYLARTLPPVASSLSVMLIPVIGVFSGALALGETPQWQDYAALVLILIALSSVLLRPR